MSTGSKFTSVGTATLQVDVTIGTLMVTVPEPPVTGSPEAAIAPALTISPASSNAPA
ncbi:hypothetical protein Q9U90_004580, partial [Salmonella enterica]|nr:hypothetical protein [Salmonella enterica]ELJ2377529.1 hypothetical protein [Salmonella enterica]